MWADGQRIERHEVEQWVQDAFAFPHFKASVTEREEPQRGIVRVITTITGPNGEPLVANNRTAVYYATRAIPGMAQMDAEWVT